MKLFQVYRFRRDGIRWHVTSIRASCLKDAIEMNAQHCGSSISEKLRALFGMYNVVGITKDTGQPYDENNFPLHVQRRIEKLKQLT